MKNNPINSHCPWSGDPVSADSTIQYRGHTVAFCNTGCRDKFSTAMKMFDAAIEQSCEPVLEPTDVPEYKPRAICFDQILTLESVRLKLYHITATTDEAIDVADCQQGGGVRSRIPTGQD